MISLGRRYPLSYAIPRAMLCLGLAIPGAMLSPLLCYHEGYAIPLKSKRAQEWCIQHVSNIYFAKHNFHKNAHAVPRAMLSHPWGYAISRAMLSLGLFYPYEIQAHNKMMHTAHVKHIMFHVSFSQECICSLPRVMLPLGLCHPRLCYH